MLCFEVTINDGESILAGHAESSAITALATYVSARGRERLDFSLSGLISRSTTGDEHVDWVNQSLRRGDTVVLRVVESAEASDSVSTRALDPEFLEKQRRRHYEWLKKEYEGKSD